MINGLPIKQPKLTDVFLLHEEKMRQNLHCVKIGIIQSYDATKRTAQVQVSFRRLMWDDTITDYPVLFDAPVFTLQGGGIGAQFPIAAKDECLLLFADSDIDLWYQNGGAQVPNSSRRHDISDCICLVGLNSLAKPLTLALAADEGGVADATAKVAIKSGMIKMSNGSLPAQSFKGMMDTFLTVLAADTVVLPATKAAAGELKTQLDALFY
jgi:hypothetical protein